MIFGRPGAGKSTFAFALSKKLNLPLYHLDKYFFEGKWKQRNYQEFLNDQQSIVNQDRWIVDGNQTKSFEMRYSKADLVLYFNYPRWLCYVRVFKRLFDKNSAIDDRAKGCREAVRLDLLKYMWSFEKRVAGKIDELREKYPNVQFEEIKNDRQLNEYKIN